MLKSLHILGWTACAAISGCAQANERHDASALQPGLPVSAFAQPLVRMPLPGSGTLEALIATDQGYAALWGSQHGGGKIAEPWTYRVAISDDGLHWTEHEVPMQGGFITYGSIAQGNGQYLLAGQASATLLSRSSDCDTWETMLSDLPEVSTLAYLEGRFFALGLHGGIYSSRDGMSFTGEDTETLQMGAIAYGAGTYIAAGSGPIMVSRDGDSWRALALDCALPSACVKAPSTTGCDQAGTCAKPSGDMIQGLRTNALYGNGHFVVDSFISEDAEHWRAIEDSARVPEAFAEGWFMRLDGDVLSAWREDEPRLTASVSDDNPQQLDCVSHSCMLFRDALILVP